MITQVKYELLSTITTNYATEAAKLENPSVPAAMPTVELTDHAPAATDIYIYPIDRHRLFNAKTAFVFSGATSIPETAGGEDGRKATDGTQVVDWRHSIEVEVWCGGDVDIDVLFQRCELTTEALRVTLEKKGNGWDPSAGTNTGEPYYLHCDPIVWPTSDELADGNIIAMATFTAHVYERTTTVYASI